MDYHSMGFRECASEVARYLVAIEGIDLQDPLRLRLMSHLQCYTAQRELAAKTATSWSPSGTPSQYPTASALPAVSLSPQPTSQSDHYANDSRHTLDTNGFRQHFPSRPPPMPLTPPSATATAMLPAPHQVPGNQYFHSAGFSPMTSTSSTTLSYGSDLSPQSGGVKPYRPWGSELAY